jgi:hypothetical protein
VRRQSEAAAALWLKTDWWPIKEVARPGWQTAKAVSLPLGGIATALQSARLPPLTLSEPVTLTIGDSRPDPDPNFPWFGGASVLAA